MKTEELTDEELLKDAKKLEKQQRGKSVITHRGYQEPTQKQLNYLNHLANELGIKTPTVKTKNGASKSIEALKKRVEDSNPNTPFDQLKDVRAEGYEQGIIKLIYEKLGENPPKIITKHDYLVIMNRIIENNIKKGDNAY